MASFMSGLPESQLQSATSLAPGRPGARHRPCHCPSRTCPNTWEGPSLSFKVFSVLAFILAREFTDI